MANITANQNSTTFIKEFSIAEFAAMHKGIKEVAKAEVKNPEAKNFGLSFFVFSFGDATKVASSCNFYKVATERMKNKQKLFAQNSMVGLTEDGKFSIYDSNIEKVEIDLSNLF